MKHSLKKNRERATMMKDAVGIVLMEMMLSATTLRPIKDSEWNLIWLSSHLNGKNAGA
jgi:hypothetical protein